MALPSRATLLPTHWSEHGDNTNKKKKNTTTTEPPRRSLSTERKAPVIYYLSRNGRLEQPHFIEVPLPSHCGPLRLRDFVRRLRLLRGVAIGDMYSWSSKRSYRDGFVWCDLSGDDPIHPVNGVEYVLKGSELLLLGSSDSFRGNSAAASVATSSSSCTGALPTRTFDLREYRIRKPDPGAGAADASTQTEAPRREARRGGGCAEGEASRGVGEALARGDGDDETKVGFYCRGRASASAVLVSLISCGAISARDRRSSVVPRWRDAAGEGFEGSRTV